MNTTHPAPTAKQLADDIHRIIEHTPASELPRFGASSVYICGLFETLVDWYGSLDRGTFNWLLIEANRQRLLTLGRADHPIAMDAELLRRSHIHDLGSDFHFVALDDNGHPIP